MESKETKKYTKQEICQLISKEEETKEIKVRWASYLAEYGRSNIIEFQIIFSGRLLEF